MSDPSLRDILNAVNALSNRLAAVESQLVGVANRLSAVEETVDSLDVRMGALESKVDSLAASTNARFDAIDRTLERMHVSLASKIDGWELAGVVERPELED